MGNANGILAPEGQDRQFDIYQLMVETWRWQIDSNWHRTAYFAAFQTAVLVAVGYAIVYVQFGISLAASVFGLLLNVVWLLNDRKTGAYTDYWRKAAESTEGSLPKHLRFVSKSEYEEKALTWGVRIACPKYNHLMLSVRLLFAVAWIAGIVLSVTAIVLKYRRYH